MVDAPKMVDTPRWISDSEAMNCLGCGICFTTFNRKHHCRKCGGVFCKKCSPHRRLLPEGSAIYVGGVTTSLNPRDPQRVCSTCQAELDPLQQSLSRTLANSVKVNKAEKQGVAAKGAAFLEGFTLGAEIRKATYTVKNFGGGSTPIGQGGSGGGDTPQPGRRLSGSLQTGAAKMKRGDQMIPRELLRRAKGLAFLHVAKCGFMFSGSLGSGLVLAKDEETGQWSAPCALACVGLGWGAQIGAEATNYVLVLTSAAAVRAFTGRGQVRLGAELGVAVGTVGRSAAGALGVGRKGLAPVVSYSHSRGLFAGVSLEGSCLLTRPDVNKNFYGEDLKPREILTNMRRRPAAAAPLYDALAVLTQPDWLSEAQEAAQSTLDAEDRVRHLRQGVVAGDPRASYSARVDEWIAQNHAGGGGALAPAPPPPPAPPAPAARGGDKENAATSGGRHGARPQLRAPFGLLPTGANTRSLGAAEWSSAASKAKAESKISAPGMSSAAASLLYGGDDAQAGHEYVL